MTDTLATLSNEYLAQLREKHLDSTWGSDSHRWLSMVLSLCSGHEIDLLDYACGKGSLLDDLPAAAACTGRTIVRATGFDPGVPRWAARPALPPYRLVVCTDALEHIEPEYLAAVLADIAQLTAPDGRVFLFIATHDAQHRLPDGRNAHLIVKPAGWWFAELARNGFVPVSHVATSPRSLQGVFRVQR